ncbi:MAG: ABC transporter permease [Lachnospiraceae bacterium]|nr:ABC transporter permease [Lachnospiraceae bacterium]
MGRYILQRVTLMLVTFFIITFICFALIRMLPLPAVQPGDPHQEVVLQRRELMGYNKPIIEQFGIFLKGLFTKWDWGVSDKLYMGQEVWSIFLGKLPPTMVTNLYSIIFAIPIGILLGIIAALRKNTWLDHFISTATMVCISVPSFVYASIVQHFLCFRWGWFPMVMATGTDLFTKEMFLSMVPAVLSLSFGVIAGFTRTTRAELTEVLTSEFMLLARTKGLTKMQATVRHALKNCMVVILPAIFGNFISIMSGSLIIEQIFSIPGVGKLYLSSINALDYPLFLLLSCFYLAIGLIAGIVVDVSYGFIDPRIRMGSRK